MKAVIDPTELKNFLNYLINKVNDADVPEGRYRASGSANFVVKNDIGSLEVNTILGDSGSGAKYFLLIKVT